MMKKIITKLMFLVFMVCSTLYLFDFVIINANDTNVPTYSYTYNGVTYYSNESEDDAWYQAMKYNYEQEFLTEEQIEEEYGVFSRRDINGTPVTYDNGSDETGDSKTYVNGYLTWTTSTGYILPLKCMRVDLYNKNLIGSEYLMTTYTDVNGYYLFEFDNDDSFWENGGYDVFIKCYPDSYTFEIARDWIFNFLTYYYFESDVVENVENGTTTDFNIGVLYEPTNMGNNAFYLSQAFVVAQRFAFQMGMTTNKFLNVIYPFTDSSGAFCYDEYAGIARNRFNNFDTAMHEYGHFVEGVLGTYGSSLIDIILYNPNHFASTDHFHDKDNKIFAMNLTWSESWATVFAQMAQQYYLSEYNGKVSGYGDLTDGIQLEQYIPTSQSCEAQENAVIAFLWDLYDSYSSTETYDNIALGYQLWWNMTTRENIQTLTDFMEVVDTYYSQYRSQIGEILGIHQISPSNLAITNLSSLSKTTPPTFSWKVNGSINNPNNRFQLVFYNLSGNVIYETQTFTSNLSYNQTYTYTLSGSAWNTILSNFINVATFNVSVKGFHSDTPVSGPYYSKYVSASVTINSHTCSYSHHYEEYSNRQHKAYCSCGNYRYYAHVVSSTSTGRFKPCVYCGYLIDTNNDVVIVGPFGLNSPINDNNYIVMYLDERINLNPKTFISNSKRK